MHTDISEYQARMAVQGARGDFGLPTIEDLYQKDMEELSSVTQGWEPLSKKKRALTAVGYKNVLDIMDYQTRKWTSRTDSELRDMTTEEGMQIMIDNNDQLRRVVSVWSILLAEHKEDRTLLNRVRRLWARVRGQ